MEFHTHYIATPCTAIAIHQTLIKYHTMVIDRIQEMQRALISNINNNVQTESVSSNAVLNEDFEDGECVVDSQEMYIAKMSG